MNKKLLLGMALVGSMAFYSCSNYEGQEQDLNEGAEQVITLAVANGNNIATRAGRPLLSSEAGQTIENVVLYIVNAGDNTIVKTLTFNNWQSEADYRTEDGKFKNIVLDEKLPDGNYEIFAVGYHTGSSYGTITDQLVSDGKFQENAVLTLSTDGSAEEIFAGSVAQFSVEKEKGFKKSVVLNRQVAGVFVYVKDIPYIEGAAKLRLVGSGENNQLVLGHFANLDLDNNGTGNSITEAVVNGATSGSAFDKVLTEVNLSDWFTNITADENNLISTGDNYDNWKKPTFSGVAKQPTFEKGSVFGGAFVIPFAKVESNQTLTLQLTDSENGVLRSWKVNLPTTPKYTLYTWDGSAFSGGTSVTENKNSYNIVRNNLYGIGERPSNDPGDGEDPDPEPGDPDKPTPLNNKHELELIVNDNWEVIHNMEIE